MRAALLPVLIALACLSAQGEPAPLQEWIDEALQAGGGIVTVPEGVHVLPRGLIIKNAQKLALRGVDKESCILKLEPSNPASAALITITGSAETLEIAGITLEGGWEKNAPSSAPPPAPLLHIAGSTGEKGNGVARFSEIVVRDCLFRHFPGPAVLLENTAAASVERCSFSDGAAAAVSFHGGQDCVAQGNHIIRAATAFELLQTGQILLEGNEVWDSPTAVRLQGPSKTTVSTEPSPAIAVLLAVAAAPFSTAALSAAVAAAKEATDRPIQVIKNNAFHEGLLHKVTPGDVSLLLENNSGLITSTEH